ncbi:MAG TPA: phosphopantothenoylcysteine decarboxylase [Planctomycetaceae bacterium]|nr:phosphopantothenoylcysteine decarboxylase [Planctomycetaceae bacterium]
MSKILITSGPTRQHIDPVRYITNSSSGRMGSCLAQACIAMGHDVTIVTGPVDVTYPAEAQLITVVSTAEMLSRAVECFPKFDGAIGAAAPCDYQPTEVASRKISKTGDGISLDLIETPDVIATLGGIKRSDQWVVGFALETDDHHFRAITKAQRKYCDLIVLNDVAAIDSKFNEIELLQPDGKCILKVAGAKWKVAEAIVATIQSTLIRPNS